jgi:hypothetical protein
MNGFTGLISRNLSFQMPFLIGILVCRHPVELQCVTLREWRFNYNIETLGAPASDETRRRAAQSLDVQIAEEMPG